MNNFNYDYEFELGDGWFGNIEWYVKDNHYKGTLYVTSEYSSGVSWHAELNDYFESSEDMIEYAKSFIRRNNT